MCVYGRWRHFSINISHFGHWYTLFSPSTLKNLSFSQKLSKLPSPSLQQWLNLLVGRFLPAEELHLVPLNPQLHLGLPPLKAGFQMKIKDMNSSHCGKKGPLSLEIHQISMVCQLTFHNSCFSC